jgi:hypothetical protein
MMYVTCREKKTENRGRFNAKGAEGAKKEHGKGCPLITRIYTNEYFAVDLILHHKIKLTASASVLLVLPPCGMVLHRTVQNEAGRCPE